MFRRLAPSWDVQVFHRQERKEPQRVLQKQRSREYPLTQAGYEGTEEEGMKQKSNPHL